MTFAQINSAPELILTELILENTLADYTPQEVVALLSIFVFVEKTDSQPVIPAKLTAGLDVIYRIADDVEREQDRCQVAYDEFKEKYKPGLVEVVYEWANGMASPLILIRHQTCSFPFTVVRILQCRVGADGVRSRSNKSPTLRMSRREPSSVSLHVWMRLVGKCETRRGSLAMPICSRRWKRLRVSSSEIVSVGSQG